MSLRVVFMGTPDFARESLKSLVESEHEVTAVVTQPDRPKGRGMKLVPSPVKEYAVNKGIMVFQPDRLKDEELINTLKSLKPDVIVVVAYGKILPKAVLDISGQGCINVHASLLPRYRGAAPIQWPIINGDKVTGVTTIYMDEGLDTGDMILSKEVVIEEDDTAQSLHDKLAVEGGRVLVETLDLVAKGQAPRVRQTGESSYARMLKKEDGLVDWSKPAKEIRNLVRGLNPWPGVYSFLSNGCIIKIWKVEVIEHMSKGRPGEIIKADCKEGLIVSTGSGALKITELQAECCKRMSSADYLIGSRLQSGDRFKTESS